MILGIHHISLLIGSEKTLNFYKLIGFTEVFRKTRNNDVVVLLDGYGLQLEVFLDARHPKRTTDITEPFGPRHIALKVDNVEIEKKRLQELCKEMISYDPEFQNTSSDWEGEKYCFFYDPDGNIIELHE